MIIPSNPKRGPLIAAAGRVLEMTWDERSTASDDRLSGGIGGTAAVTNVGTARSFVQAVLILSGRDDLFKHDAA